MFEKIKFWLVTAAALVLLLYVLPFQSLFNYIKYEFYPKNDLKINLSLVNPEVKRVTADSSNRLILRVEVYGSDGEPVPKASVSLAADKGLGRISPSKARTDRNGEAIVSYIPPDNYEKILNSKDNSVTLTASIFKSSLRSSVNIILDRIPVVFVHGYQENPNVFDNMNDYLTRKGYNCSVFDYVSEKGVIPASEEMEAFLRRRKEYYLSEGFQVKRFNIVSHSMGGLVARYYSSSDRYVRNNDISKIVFVSVPNAGSPWAVLGMKYFNDQGIRDLCPDSALFTDKFPGMLNKGLNRTIQVGSIMGQYDEVVTPESASLEEWDIKTELFSVGGNNLTVNGLLSGDTLSAANHRSILSNKKVFDRIAGMLASELPYPSKR